MKDEAKSYKELVKSLKLEFIEGGAGTGSVDLLVKLQSAAVNLFGRTKELIRLDQKLEEAIDRQAADPTLKAEMEAIKNEVIHGTRKRFTTVENYYHQLRGFGNKVKFTIKGRDYTSESLQFSDKVYKLGLGDLPATTQFDLLYSGSRQANDVVVLKVAAAKNQDSEPRELEQHSLRLMNALPHLELSVAYSFARPTDDANGEEWRGGPIYSMLLKFGSRNKNYRTFVDAGIGINFAAYDFNGDGTPEISTGIGGSLFRDYWQGGVGYNFNAGAWYYFAGLRIPIPIVPIGVAIRTKKPSAESYDVDF